MDELVALYLDDRALEQLLRTLRGNTRIGAGVHLDLVRAGNLDLLEAPDLVVARDGRAGILMALLAAGARRG